MHILVYAWRRQTEHMKNPNIRFGNWIFEFFILYLPRFVGSIQIIQHDKNSHNVPHNNHIAAILAFGLATITSRLTSFTVALVMNTLKYVTLSIYFPISFKTAVFFPQFVSPKMFPLVHYISSNPRTCPWSKPSSTSKFLNGFYLLFFICK